MKGIEVSNRLTRAVVSASLLLACGCAVVGSDRPIDRNSVSAMRTANATPERWLNWARSLPSPRTWKVEEGGSYFLGGRRCLMTRFYWMVFWGDTWTPSDCSIKFEMPRGSYVWLENHWKVVPIDDPEFERMPVEADSWILIVHGDMLGVVSLSDGYALVVPRPHP